MAAAFDGGVILGADSRTSSGNYVGNRVSDKLTALSEKVGCLLSCMNTWVYGPASGYGTCRYSAAGYNYACFTVFQQKGSAKGKAGNARCDFDLSFQAKAQRLQKCIRTKCRG